MAVSLGFPPDRVIRDAPASLDVPFQKLLLHPFQLREARFLSWGELASGQVRRKRKVRAKQDYLRSISSRTRPGHRGYYKPKPVKHFWMPCATERRPLCVVGFFLCVLCGSAAGRFWFCWSLSA